MDIGAKHCMTAAGGYRKDTRSQSLLRDIASSRIDRHPSFSLGDLVVDPLHRDRGCAASESIYRMTPSVGHRPAGKHK